MTHPLVKKAAMAMFARTHGFAPSPMELGTYCVYAVAAARVLLSAEPTEEMVVKAFNAEPLPNMRANRRHYYDAIKAANAALLEELNKS